MTFEEAFREINGRMPTIDETKRALAIRRVVRDADLDPVMLFFLADANAAAERERLPEAVKSAVDAGVQRIETALPTNTEWVKAASWAAWFAKAMSKGMNTVLIGGGIVGVAIVVMTIFAWRYGYAAGWDNRGYDGWISVNKTACQSLENSRHRLAAHHLEADELQHEMTARGC